MTIVANAPVSYGVFELTIGEPGLPGPEEILAAVAGAGYGGIDLGPLGFLGRGPELVDRLARHGLALAGGYVALRFPDPDGLREDLELLDRTLDVFQEAARTHPPLLPRPTLADAGSPERRANPGRGKDLPEIGLDEAGWRRFADGVARAAERCRDRGFEPTFHHHACSYVEAPHEIERFLELTDVGLCLDSGHLLIGGGDPVQALVEWGQRIDHLQIKDARTEVLRAIVEERAGMRAVWERRAFCSLGSGNLDIQAFLDRIRQLDYDGWLIVEEDRILAGPEDLADAIDAQARNREFLRRWSW